MLYKNFGFKKSKTKHNILYTAPHVKSSVKLDSFLNFSKISNDSLNSIHKDNNNNNLIINVESIQKQKSKQLPKQKLKKVNKNKDKDKKYHKHSYCVDNLKKTLNKSKSALSRFIITNTSTKKDFFYPNIKLLGNSRYKYTSPIMFVEDQKNNMPDINLGLVPIPMERFKVEMSEKEENEREKKLYELQRSIVMLRRRQYNLDADKKKLRNQFIDYNSNSYKNEIDDISEYINKIVLIQKWWNSFSKKNEMENKINKFIKKLRTFVRKSVLNILKKYLVQYQKPLNLLCYIIKKRKRFLHLKNINQNILKNNDQTSLNYVEVNENNINSNRKDLNINNKEINDTNIKNQNVILNKLDIENNNKEELKNKFSKDKNVNENIENISNGLNNNSQIEENNDLEVNDEDNNIEIKNLTIRDNYIGNKISENKNIKSFQKYNFENLKLFSDYIKKIFLMQLINELKAIDISPAIKVNKVKQCFISKIKKIKGKKLNIEKTRKIERMQLRIEYTKNEIFKKPLQNEFNSISENSCYISKSRIRKKMLPNNLVNIKNINNNISLINKNGFASGFFLSKIIFKQENSNIVKIQKFFKNKNKGKEKENEIKTKNNITYKSIQKQPCYASIIRKYNYMKLITAIQETYKTHMKNEDKNESIIKKTINHNCYYISKKRSVIFNQKINKNNLNYLLLLIRVFITKNTQEYIFQILKTRKPELISKNKLYFPFYLRTLQRIIINYLQKSDNPNKKIELFFTEIFNYKKTKVTPFLNSICFLEEKNKNKLINSNLFTGFEENDLINFLSDFSEFDKNLNNETFIIERLKKIKLNNTNIFTLVKLIDNEYNNLVKGFYCFKCYNETYLCTCKNSKEMKNSYSNDINKSIDKSEDNLNFDDLSDDVDSKRQINFFDYNKDGKIDNNILIKTKTSNNDINNNNKKLLDIILPENNNNNNNYGEK